MTTFEGGDVRQGFHSLLSLLIAQPALNEGAEAPTLQHGVHHGGCRRPAACISIFSIHLIDRIRTLAGSPPQKISATTRHWNPDVQGETFASLIVQFENGIVGTMISNWHALTLSECRLRIDGTKGSALSIKKNVLSDEATLHIRPRNRELETRTFYRKDAFTHAMGESMNHLLDAARRGAEPIHSGRGNLYTMQIVDAAYLSAERGGEMVAVDEVK